MSHEVMTMTVVTIRRFTPEEQEVIRRSVEQLFQEVASRFPHATVRIEPPGPTERPTLFHLSCSLPGTTSVEALAGGDELVLHLGKATWFEPYPRRRHVGRLLDTVRDVVEGVVAGSFEERLIDTDDSVIGARSTIRRRGRKLVVSRCRRLSKEVLSNGHERNVRYAPYG